MLVVCTEFFLYQVLSDDDEIYFKLQYFVTVCLNVCDVFCFRIIEIAGGREVFSQSRCKVASRKQRFLTASNSLTNDDSQSDNKLSLKKNNKSPNRQSVWELRSR